MFLGSGVPKVANLGFKNGIDHLHGGAKFTKAPANKSFFSTVFSKP
ncbi:MAG: hypothetical protein ACJAQT_004221, partial [Akkermansiaceae bacterium]